MAICEWVQYGFDSGRGCDKEIAISRRSACYTMRSMSKEKDLLIVQRNK